MLRAKKDVPRAVVHIQALRLKSREPCLLRRYSSGIFQVLVMPCTAYVLILKCVIPNSYYYSKEASEIYS